MPRPTLPPRFADRSDLRAHRDGLAIEDLPGGWLVVDFPGTEFGEDPHFRFRTSKAVGLYETGPGGNLTLRGTVRCASAASVGAALRCARLLGRLARLFGQRFSDRMRFARDVESFEAWLVDRPAADPSVGGETRTCHIFVWDIATARSEFEWARTIAHEFGHLVLPAARGFAAPEGDAAGYLGEALFIQFLLEDDAPGIGDDFAKRDDLRRYVAERNAPRLRDFDRTGPADRRIDRLDAAGMETYIGGALSIDRGFGSATLWKALRGIDDETPRELFASLRKVVLARREFTVRLPVWVPFYADRYTLARNEGSGLLAISGAAPVPVDPFHATRFSSPGWRWLAPGPGGLSRITIRRGAR